MNAPAKPNPWPALDAKAIFAPLEPMSYLLKPLDLCAGAPALVAGYGFSGKTVAMQSLALSVAAGDRKVWGLYTAARGKVLHIDYEQGSRLTRERYQRLAAAAGMLITPQELDGRLVLVSMPQLYLDAPAVAAEDAFCRYCEGCSLVIVDSLRAACPTLEENDSAVRGALDRLNRVSAKTGASFVVIHHARKPNKDAAGGAKMSIRGSGAIFDACGSVLVMEAQKGQATRVTHEKARTLGVCADEFLLRIEDQEVGYDPRGGLVVTAEGAPAAAAGSSNPALDARVLEIVRANPGTSGRGVRVLLGQYSNDTVLNALERLRLAGLVYCKPGPNRSMVWWPSEAS